MIWLRVGLDLRCGIRYRHGFRIGGDFVGLWAAGVWLLQIRPAWIVASVAIDPRGEFVSDGDYIVFSAGGRDLVGEDFSFGGCYSTWGIRLQRDGRGHEWRHRLGVDI